MSGRFQHVPALRAEESVAVDGSNVLVFSIDLTDVTRPIGLLFGPLSMSATPAEAIALGNALIRIAHHYTATLTAHQQAQIAQAVQP